MKISLIWILWLTATLVFLLSTRNPLYLVLILGGLFILGDRLARQKEKYNWVLQNFRFLVTMTLLSMLINGLFSHVGSTVLLTIPQGWPLIGGNLTFESLAYGAINGLVIGALYLLFNILNLALNIKQITRLIPRAFQPVAILVTIALTFFPSIQQRAREIKEAQMIRGNPMKKVSDWLPIFVPLLVTSLENAILLAESMTARGFHKQADLRSPRILISLILSLFAVFTGWILQLYRYPLPIFISLYLLGCGLFTATFIVIGKSTKITRYHHETWGQKDWIMMVLITITLISFAYFALGNHLPSLFYSPYPHLSIPPIQSLGIIFSLLPLLPIAVLRHDKD